MHPGEITCRSDLVINEASGMQGQWGKLWDKTLEQIDRYIILLMLFEGGTYLTS